ncbi:spore coat polysaccharide biosynthesis protein SpsF [Proteiniborus ethanoligenes]|uniref:Spore coat polysaccharide biosynthesis protein SpsF n=1 Tax=Proteiniborus ethanoligenes TaxID=415015 RepID=A0A1H3S4A5_9FIRM|nr:glycosyltransferase family protein [Proteiniborus ethanoligenes]SDZ32762.1 spore coat polysaccharide biosynthesis protein SpsF [Proteiniborus ethanoligenes]
MKILCIVQARMGSERLPGKVIKPILGKPMILYTLDRLKRSKYIDEIVLATSTSEKEEPLVQVVAQEGYNIFRGEEHNVLKRYIDAYEKFGGDIIIRITGDCPLIDPQIVDNVISHYLMYDYDYVRLDVPDTFIRGFDVEVFSAKALERAYEEVNKSDEEQYKEHVTLYMYRNKDKFRVGYVKGDKLYNKDYRLCVDTVEDFEVVSKVYEYFKDEYVGAKEVVEFLDGNRDVAEINIGVMQKGR